MKAMDDMDFERKIDFFKIDTEGMELEVLAGAREMILTDKPFLYVENQPYFSEPKDFSFVNAAVELGYRCMPIRGLEQHEIILC